MSPEERAKKAVDHFSSELGWVHWDNDQLITLIATAIREAEDAAYERAAAKFDHDPDGALSMRFIAMHIRSLKSQEP